MVFQFSKNLIEETIQCFKEEDNLTITPEQANEYLNSLAKLFLAFHDPGERRGGAPKGPAVPDMVDNKVKPSSSTGTSNTRGTL